MRGDLDLAALRRLVGYGADDEALVRGLHDRLWPKAPAASPLRLVDAAGDDAGLGRTIAGPGFEAHRADGPAVAGSSSGHAAGESGPDALRTIGVAGGAVDRAIDELGEEWRAAMVSPRWDDARREHRRSLGGRFAALGEGVLPVLLTAGRIRRELLEAVAPTGDELSRHELRAVERLMDLEQALVVHGFEAWLRERGARQERAAALGSLSASIAHELRNPLGVIDSSVFLLRKHVERDPRAMGHLDRIAGQVRLSSRIIGGVMELVRGAPPGAPAAEVLPAIDAAAEGIRLPPGAALEVEAAPGTPHVRIAPHELHQVLVNLLGNAADAAGAGGKVLVDVRPDGDALAIRVSDSGPGIDPAIRDRVFEPLVTAKAGGVGLGLALCRAIVERHGGTIDLGPSALGGATFVIRLPVRP